MSKAIEILKDIVGILERQKELGNIDKIIDIELEYHKKAIAEIEAQEAYLKGDISVYAFVNIQADVILEIIKELNEIKELISNQK